MYTECNGFFLASYPEWPDPVRRGSEDRMRIHCGGKQVSVLGDGSARIEGKMLSHRVVLLLFYNNNEMLMLIAQHWLFFFGSFGGMAKVRTQKWWGEAKFYNLITRLSQTHYSRQRYVLTLSEIKFPRSVILITAHTGIDYFYEKV